MDGLSRCVRQTKDTYKRPCRTVVSTPPMGGVRTRDGNMPALKEISFEYARQIASVKGLQPGKVRGTSTLRFTKGDSDKLQVITWDEFVQTANNRNLAVYESGGWMKLMRKHRSEERRGGKEGETEWGGYAVEIKRYEGRREDELRTRE